ncbi:CoA pyrophosphatase [Mesorhizobium sp. M0761]|uniref:CoA pyrophosphatase n=1 Tax=unclassified Mesorhizobium TaxID=325217 RepID=UPI0003CF2529|nr:MULTISPECIES: CoA pyrophosphatase [unclassified Mesorhizobium]ESX90760.1 DNA mismatch repair protein MutT [Mesorhizobium sp. LSHC412B00]ESY07492.1 DNA mismatch repair protein MutT [Mesorhizobium sp. LNJC399B00]ESY50070.1 DNA mismatch repair protein MutT [Mesorhizobium sp. LNJC380A00]ESY54017.1 DNA mismatch repair protein MutT [Mesorhizobium sp. LNJC374B00]ESY61713.1 DNA mismatch repair protein MutT [Mesorhizobium sp. LNJC372A00]
MDQVRPPPFSTADFRARVAAQAEAHAGDDYGDHRFNPGHPRLTQLKALRDAAVLIPVVDHGRDATVLLTKRAEKLRSHSGQVAFPGGTIDPTDATPEAAALRETFEEIGLGQDRIEIIGRMPDYVAGSGYRIAPVLAIVEPGFTLSLNSDEVDAAFEVPLSFLMDPANHTRDSRMWNDLEWFFYDMPYGGQRIWGVTAGIIRTLYERLYA